MDFRKLNLAFQYTGYKLCRPHRKGHGIHSPFLFDFVNQVIRMKKAGTEKIEAIQALQKNLRKSKETIPIEDLGAGSSHIPNNIRKISDITRYSSTNHKKGKLLYHIIRRYKPEVIIELGTCLGLGTMYLASGNPDSQVFTLEGCPNLVQMSRDHFNQLGFKNIISLQGKFDDTLPEILSKTGSFGLVFVDGHHTKEATLRYFRLLLPYATAGSIIVFDDIRWSEEMEQAWIEICRQESVKLSLDLFTLGIVFFNPKIIKQHYQLYY